MFHHQSVTRVLLPTVALSATAMVDSGDLRAAGQATTIADLRRRVAQVSEPYLGVLSASVAM
jgi:hypothetical protein